MVEWKKERVEQRFKWIRGFLGRYYNTVHTSCLRTVSHVILRSMLSGWQGNIIILSSSCRWRESRFADIKWLAQPHTKDGLWANSPVFLPLYHSAMSLRAVWPMWGMELSHILPFFLLNHYNIIILPSIHFHSGSVNEPKVSDLSTDLSFGG